MSDPSLVGNSEAAADAGSIISKDAWINIIVGVIGAYITMYILGLWVQRGGRVGYARKGFHFYETFYAMFGRYIIPYEASSAVMALLLLAFALMLFTFTGPILRRSSIARTMFACIDRPEDRPHTVKLMITQWILGYCAIIPLSILFESIGKPDLLHVPGIVNGFGDGLAEPVGVRWGRHKYSVRGWFTKNHYTRSIEGSCVVFVFGIIAVLTQLHEFTTIQLSLAFAIFPIAVTLAEAFAPHTMDTPLIFGIGGAIIYIIHQLPF